MADEVAIRFAEKDSIMAPGQDAFAVTPSDTVSFSLGTNSNIVARALYIGTAGNLVALTERGNLATFFNLTTATILPLMCKRVNATNTTASGIVALY